MALLAISLSIQALSLCLSLGWLSGRFDPLVLLATYGAFLQAAVIAAVCLAFSVKCSPPLAGTIGAATFLIGNLSGAFIRFFLVEDRDSIVSASLARGLKTLVPNLSVFNLKDPAVHNLAIPSGYFPSISYYAIAWITIMLMLSTLVFYKEDL